jgi:diacylglycerol O-acyltransferase / wax synthase
MLIRFHHLLADGIAALRLLGTLFDPVPNASQPQAPPWIARSLPTRSELLLNTLHKRITALRRGVHKITHPRHTVAPARTFVRQAVQLAHEGRGSADFVQSTGQPAAPVSWSCVPISNKPSRSHTPITRPSTTWCCARSPACPRAPRRPRRASRPLVLKVSVAASVRARTSASPAGNLDGILLVSMPVDEEDPARRLEQIARETADGNVSLPTSPRRVSRRAG